MKKFILSFCGFMVIPCVSFAVCPNLAGKYSCPGLMTVPAFQLEIIQIPGEGFVQYDLIMSGGYKDKVSSKASVAGFKNEDGTLTSCASGKVVVQGKVATLGEVEGQVYLGAKNTVRVTLLGATPEPWEALVCKRI